MGGANLWKQVGIACVLLLASGEIGNAQFPTHETLITQNAAHVQQKTVVRFESIYAPIVKVVVDGVTIRMGIDTGAAVSYLSPLACKKLGKQLHGLGKDRVCPVDSLQVGDWKAVLPQSHLAVLQDANAAPFDKDMDGLLGMDILRNIALQWDFARNEVVLLSPGNLGKTPYGPDSVQVKLQERAYPALIADLTGYTFSVAMGFEDMKGVLNLCTLELDTGTSQTVLPTFVAPHARKLHTIYNYVVSSVNSPIRAFVSRLPYLSFGKVSVDEPVVAVVPEDHLFSGGLLGRDVLGHFHVTIDFPAKMLYLEADPDYKEMRTWHGLGFHSKKEKDQVLVDSVYTPSPAAKAGLKDGDIIEAFDQHDMKKFSAEEFGKYRTAWKEGQVIVLRVRRKGENKARLIRVAYGKLL